MRTIRSTSTGHRSLKAAHRRAGQQPEARLACPVCATSLKGANFERHLHEKHPDVDITAERPRAEDSVRLVGVDRRIRRTFAVIAVLWLVALAVAVVLRPGPIGAADDDTSASVSAIAAAPFVAVLAAGMVLLVALAGLDALGVFRARLTITGGEVRLRHRVGTGRRQISLPAGIETGTLYVRRSRSHGTNTEGGASVSERAGAYLRIGSGRRSITVGCPHATGLRKHWTGWTGAKQRKWWDLNLDAPAFVELQYALADAGVLSSPS